MVNHRAFKDEINAQFARIAKALSNAHRFEIMDLLAQGERSVEEIAAETELTPANASQHLQTLREAHLVRSRKEGLRVYYRLADPTVFRPVQAIRETAKRQLADVERIVDAYLLERDSLKPIALEELRAQMEKGDLVLLDVRPLLEYRQGHIVGAVSIPVEELNDRLGELEPQSEIVAYCRGPYCVFADEAVKLLASRGYHVRRMQEGYPDWELAGLPVERTIGEKAHDF